MSIRGLVSLSTFPQQHVTEPEIEIRLTCDNIKSENEVRFVFKESEYQRVLNQDSVIDLLTIPSRVIHREVRELQEQQKEDIKDEADEEGKGENRNIGYTNGPMCTSEYLSIHTHMHIYTHVYVYR